MIDEKIYTTKYKDAPDTIRVYILNIFKNSAFDRFVFKHWPELKEKKDKTDILRNNTALLCLEIINLDSFIEQLFDLFNIEDKNVDYIIDDFFESCIPGSISSYLEKITLDQTSFSSIDKNESIPVEATSYDNKNNDSNHISHIDVLNEIENPTPSINTTTTFRNQVNTDKQTTPNTLKTAQNNPSSRTNTTLQTSQISTPSLHSSDPSVVPYSNPALHIASKLDQNLSSPSASVPKDVYVSKRPDPYHEPVEM